MDSHGENDDLVNEIKKILEHHFNRIDEEVLSYLIGIYSKNTSDSIWFDLQKYLKKKGVINLNKDDFSSVEDIYDAVGAILDELEGKKLNTDINQICEKFYNVLKW